MELNRRTMLAGAALFAGASATASDADLTSRSGYDHPFQHDTAITEHMAMLVYPGMTILDLVGPYHFLCFMGGAKIHLVTNQPDLKTVLSDAGMGILPTMTMADCPRDLALLFPPGGTSGTLRAARDPATLAFMSDRGQRAKLVSSVCTGSLLLGAAGLLRNKRATSHWSVVSNLSQFGATPVHERVVEDGNIITAAGVSAGLDSGALLIARLRGRPLAEAALLATEYAPQPPYRGGTIKTARPQIRRAVSENLRGFVEEVRTLRPMALAGEGAAPGSFAGPSVDRQSRSGRTLDRPRADKLPSL